jgi:hypothetical protein
MGLAKRDRLGDLSADAGGGGILDAELDEFRTLTEEPGQPGSVWDDGVEGVEPVQDRVRSEGKLRMRGRS